MSDDKTSKDVKDAKPAQPGEGDGARLTSRQTTLGDHIFIWTMVILVGLIFGIGPSFGLVFASRRPLSSYNVDPIQVEHRQATAEVLQRVIGEEYWAQRDIERYARAYRKSQVAEDRNLMPSRADGDALVEEFFARTTSRGRTYLEQMRDSREGSELSREALRTYLVERFANDALDARLVITPVLSQAAARSTAYLAMASVAADQVTLSVHPLIEAVAEDDPELERTYDILLGRDRFIEPAVRLVTVAVADLASELAAQPEPSDEAIAAHYEAHKANFTKPISGTPDVGQTPPVAEVLTLEEAKPAVIAAIKRAGAERTASQKANELQTLVEELNLENADAAAFAAAAEKAGCVVHVDIEISEENTVDLHLGAFGELTGRTARSIGLVAGKPGEYISDALKTDNGNWAVIRLIGRREARRRPLDDPGVRAEVRQYLAETRAYPKLLAAAEELRAKADAAGPGGLRTVFADAEVAAKWQVEVKRVSLTTQDSLVAPEAADDSTTRGESRLAISMAIKGNPVVLAAAPNYSGERQVRLIQCADLKNPEPLPETAIASYLPRVRGSFGYGLMSFAYQALERELGD